MFLASCHGDQACTMPTLSTRVGKTAQSGFCANYVPQELTSPNSFSTEKEKEKTSRKMPLHLPCSFPHTEEWKQLTKISKSWDTHTSRSLHFLPFFLNAMLQQTHEKKGWACIYCRMSKLQGSLQWEKKRTLERELISILKMLFCSQSKPV